MFQSPSLRGSGRFRADLAESRCDAPRVSIPFIAGQWSLHPDGSGGVDPAPVFQSPSLRGSGRFPRGGRSGEGPGSFQSPSLRGSGRFKMLNPRGRRSAARVSIPFIAGQWSLLHVIIRLLLDALEVSIPFIAGQWSLPSTRRPSSRSVLRFQSPSLRGSGRFFILVVGLWALVMFQSPSLRGSGRFSITELPC